MDILSHNGHFNIVIVFIKTVLNTSNGRKCINLYIEIQRESLYD